MGDQLAVVAKAFPKTKFAIIDFPWVALKGKPKNARGVLFAEQEAGYLAGVAAAFESKSGTVSSVGGQAVPAVVHFLAGYKAGARKQKPSIKVLSGYSQEFVDQAKCKELALNQIDQGSDAVFAAAGGCGLGALTAAKERKVWGLGVDSDQAFLGKHILASATKKVDVGVFSTIALAKAGKFKGATDTLFNVKNGGVGYGHDQHNGAAARSSDRPPERDLEADRRRHDQASVQVQPVGYGSTVGGPRWPPAAVFPSIGRHRARVSALQHSVARGTRRRDCGHLLSYCALVHLMLALGAREGGRLSGISVPWKSRVSESQAAGCRGSSRVADPALKRSETRPASPGSPAMADAPLVPRDAARDEALSGHSVANDDVSIDLRRGEGARPAGRERRREVDADERRLRSLPPRRGRDR